MSHWLYAYVCRHPIMNCLSAAIIIGLAIDFCRKIQWHRK